MSSVTVVTVASANRRAHLDNQQSVLRDLGARRIVVWLDDDPPPSSSDDSELDADVVLHVPPAETGLRLARARNVGADRAVADGADVVVLLDADCVPGRSLLTRYAAAAGERPDAVLCGPVTYLPPGADALSPAALEAGRAPHAARPDPADGEILSAPDSDYRLFWSLSFAVSADLWAHGPRFDEGYAGYGGEDTDFAYRLRAAGVPLGWVGGADAYHQHHPTSSPPVQHVDDILRNGARFADAWGEWPMLGWLEAFAELGLVERRGDGWVRAGG